MEKTEQIIITYFRLSEQERNAAAFAGRADAILRSGRFAIGNAHIVVLNDDGTVSAHGDNGRGQCNVSGWTDITKVAAGDYHTVGLRSDGTVVATGDNSDGQCSVSGWTDIEQLYADRRLTLGVTTDGKLIFSHKPVAAASPDAKAHALSKTETNDPDYFDPFGSADTGDAPLTPEIPRPDNALPGIAGPEAGIDLSEYDYHVTKNGSVCIDKYNGSDATVVIPYSIDGVKVTLIGEYAFYGNSVIKEVILPQGLRVIGSSAFNSCTALESVNIPESTVTISDWAFGFCKNLKTLKLPEGLRTIAPYAFSYCNNLSEVTIPDSIETIGSKAFSPCIVLLNVNISKETRNRLGSAALRSAGLTLPAGK